MGSGKVLEQHGGAVRNIAVAILGNYNLLIIRIKDILYQKKLGGEKRQQQNN